MQTNNMNHPSDVKRVLFQCGTMGLDHGLLVEFEDGKIGITLNGRELGPRLVPARLDECMIAYLDVCRSSAPPIPSGIGRKRWLA